MLCMKLDSGMMRNNPDDWKFVMDGVIEDYLKDTEYGAEYTFCEFFAEYIFDIVGCDVL